MEIDLYSYFRIEFGCSELDIKRAYKVKAKSLHPDKNKDNPNAKEEFQKLQEYYEILSNASKKAQYDQKFKAKLEAEKRKSAMTIERRLMKEKLEAQEMKAASELNERKKILRKHEIAEQIRRNWQAEQEAAAYSAKKERELLEEVRLSAEAQYASTSDAVTLKVKWNQDHSNDSSENYDQKLIRKSLELFGEILHLIMGKKGTAVVEFSSSKDAEKALNASQNNQIGLHSNPLILTWISGKPINIQVLKQNPRTSVEEVQVSKEDIAPKTNFDSFEADILKRMTQYT